MGVTVTAYKRRSDGRLADVKPIDPNRGRRSSITRTGMLRLKLQGQTDWSTVSPSYLAEHFEKVESGEG